MTKKKKYKIEIDKVYPKPKAKYYEDTISEAKRCARHMLENNPQGIVRIKKLKVNGKSYKAVSSHWWAKNRETGRDRIVGL